MPLSSPELIDTIHKGVSLFLTWIKWIVCITWKKIPKLGTCCNLNSQPHITDVAISRFRDFNPPYCRILVCVKVPCASFTAIPMSPLVYTRLQMAFSLQPQGAQAMGCHIRVCICSNFAPVRNSPKSAEISQTQRKEHTRLQGSLFQSISRYSPEIRVHILYHRNPIQNPYMAPHCLGFLCFNTDQYGRHEMCPLRFLSVLSSAKNASWMITWSVEK